MFIMLKVFIMLYSFDWPNFIFWLPFYLEILGNICIVIGIASLQNVDDIFMEILSSPDCVAILFNCIKNVESKIAEIFS